MSLLGVVAVLLDLGERVRAALRFRWHVVLVAVGIGLLCWFCARDGLLAWVPGHYPWTNIQIVPVASRSLPADESRKLLSDLPSVLLGISSLASAFLYGQLRRHLRGLEAAMKSTLIVSDSFTAASDDPDFKVFAQPLKVWVLRLIWFVSMGAGVGLFFIARGVKLYPDSWWARYGPGHGWFEHAVHIGRIAMWIFVGSEGLFAGMAAMAAFLAATAALKRLRLRSSPDTNDGFCFEYVEPWQRPQQGWGVLWALMRLKVWGVVTMLPSLTGLYLILAQRESFRPVLGLIVVGVLVVSLRQFAILNLVPLLYEDTVGREIARNSAMLTHADAEQDRQANARRDDYLHGVMKNQRGYSLIVGRVVTGLTLATSVAGVVVPLLTK